MIIPVLPSGSERIAVIGLGYVGLPLAVALASRHETLGFDLKAERIAELQAGRDSTGEADLVGCDVFIGAVPTPIDASRHPDLAPPIAASRSVGRLVRAMIGRDLAVKGARVLVAGLTFKEDCPDTRNTKVVDLVAHLRDYGMAVEVVDPLADPAEVRRVHRLEIGRDLPDGGAYDVLILAVAHRALTAAGPAPLRALLRDGGLLFDLKAAFGVQDSDLRL